MNLQLFSTPGAYPLQDIVAASKPYLPAAGTALNSEYVDVTRAVFENLAEVGMLDVTQPISLVDIESALEWATVPYIPGGNTYLLLDRLYRNGAFSLIQARVQARMPLVGFSAGVMICGKNILMSNDNNDCGSTKFAGLGFTKYNFTVHYPAGDREDRARRDAEFASIMPFTRIRSWH